MPCLSEARISANRANAARSTGPKTPEGKERSRRNGLKHGMSGRGVVLPEEVADEVEQRAEALRDDLDPKSPLGQILVRQMATLSVRMERAERQESASLAGRVRRAGDELDEARLEDAARLFKEIVGDPSTVVRKLRKSPEGCDRLIKEWRIFRSEVVREPWMGWNRSHFDTARNLQGQCEEEARESRVMALMIACSGRFEQLASHDGPGLDVPARKAWARQALVEWIVAEIAGLEAHRSSLDFEAFEQERAEAAEVALFDPSPEATLARRYESESRRGFFKALREYRQAEAEAADRAEAAKSEIEAPEEVAPEPEAPTKVPKGPSVGSCRRGPGEIPRRPLEGPSQGTSDRNWATTDPVVRPSMVAKGSPSPG